MSKHKHAEAMMEYAKDAQVTDKPWELWEVEIEAAKCGGRRWFDLDGHPAWHPKVKYRRKIKTITINGHEVPEPAQETPRLNQRYYYASTGNHDLAGTGIWSCDKYGMELLRRRVIHLTKEAAIAHTKALLSFTQQGANNE